ncbi:uncharacterized protein Ecym_7088 [Eremothecium cymbalariae DBVPG|uniref:Uncharacterized protein n=1 Tax=Eremothecium cymbalariae (strain CBS 270.75 / DBVPG 7215 / KCTC 17166 / NRRL Y-17582) TaxID=931890 RepID=G8JVS5_ERECY|nr:hypothetical protein Ecym_7088 [Eremothecium cymbalariae DBVPG\
MAERSTDTAFAPHHMENGDIPDHKDGRKNSAITSPIVLDDYTGEVLVKKATGKSKIRKGQSEEDYQDQLVQFFQCGQGPVRTEVGWMDKLCLENHNYDISIKQERQKLTSYCQRLYFNKKFHESHEFALKLLELYRPMDKKNKMVKEIEELEYIIKNSKEKQSFT